MTKTYVIYKYSNGQGGEQVKMIGQGIFGKSVFLREMASKQGIEQVERI